MIRHPTAIPHPPTSAAGRRSASNQKEVSVVTIRTVMDKNRNLILNAALAALAIGCLIGIHFLTASQLPVQAQSSPTPTPSPGPTPEPTPTPGPTPTPSPGSGLCSPGFWKNHTELWFGPDYCGETSEQILCDLKPQCAH